jgi:RNA polymerase sigma-70 factor (ECF subfamily)
MTRLMADQSAVADVVQETFLAAAKSAKGYDKRRGSLWVWLWTIGRRQIALHYRRQKPTVSLDQAVQWWNSLNGQQVDILDQMAAPPAMLETRELGELVRRCLEQLTAEQETLLLAKYVDQIPVKKIAKQLHCSVVAARSKLARARKTFKCEFRKLTNNVPVSGRES